MHFVSIYFEWTLWDFLMFTQEVRLLNNKRSSNMLKALNKAFNALYYKFHDFILYGIIGCFSSSLDFLLYTLFVSVLHWHYILSNCISVLVGITTSFILNRKYNFKVTDDTQRRFAIFLTVGLAGMMLSNFILYICIEIIQLNPLLSKILSIILVVFLQFLTNKYITFRPKNNHE